MNIPFGGRIQTPYILDAADADGDGMEDFAISAKTYVPPGKDPSGAKFVHSFIVRVEPSKMELSLHDLGANGMTQRTWAGKFIRTSATSSYFILGRNGEIGLPHTLRGEQTSIFKVSAANGGLALRTAYVSRKHSTTASVSACTIREPGSANACINTVNSPFFSNREFLQPEAFSIGQGVSQINPRSLVRGIDGGGAHNKIEFGDIDGDGRCDLLAAFEVWKVGDSDQAYTDQNITGRARSYVILSGSNRRIDLPAPFGSNNSTFGIGTGTADGRRFVAATSSEFRGHSSGFRKFRFQLLEFIGGSLVDVSSTLLSGEISNRTANQSFVVFKDINGDGADDIYLTRYDSSIQVYIWDNGRFRKKRISGGGGGEKSVAFLNSDSKACTDLAVLNSAGKLSLHSCR